MSGHQVNGAVRVGIIGGGLMGREMASAFARWCALEDPDLPTPVLTAVADPSEAARAWFQNNIPGMSLVTGEHHELLASDEVDVVYVAVPHHLHAEIYLDTIEAGKDLLAEKPFGIDLAAATAVADLASRSGQFVRVSSEFPFFPAVQEIVSLVRCGNFFGRTLEVNAGFHHASDLDPNKPANWKRRSSTCGAIGVMGDLGLHVCHVPARLGWEPVSVYAQLQHGFAERPDGSGGTSACDTFDNATLHTWAGPGGTGPFPLRMEMKRLAPGATNTWWLEVIGTEGGARFSTARPKTLETYQDGAWTSRDLGFTPPVKTITGGIFEFGFPDAIQQMWAAYLLERANKLGSRFGCATPAEALASHRLFDAALQSQSDNQTIRL